MFLAVLVAVLPPCCRRIDRSQTQTYTSLQRTQPISTLRCATVPCMIPVHYGTLRVYISRVVSKRCCEIRNTNCKLRCVMTMPCELLKGCSPLRIERKERTQPGLFGSHHQHVMEVGLALLMRSSPAAASHLRMQPCESPSRNHSVLNTHKCNNLNVFLTRH